MLIIVILIGFVRWWSGINFREEVKEKCFFRRKELKKNVRVKILCISYIDFLENYE